MREIVLDTETTGFDPRSGHRMVEIGCIELENLTPTGRTFHTLINPDRIIEAEVVRVHGITNEKVRDAPKFAEIADDLHAFIEDSPVIAHNASFDRNFVNFELELCGRGLVEDLRWIDTLQLAQKRFPGMANSLGSTGTLNSMLVILTVATCWPSTMVRIERGIGTPSTGW